MSWLDEFRTENPKVQTDNTDNNSLNKVAIQTTDTLIFPETGLPPTDNTDSWIEADLEASARRLEAVHISIAIREDGAFRVFQGNEQPAHGETKYEPREMILYIQLSQRDRRMLHSFKRKFGGHAEVQR